MTQMTNGPESRKKNEGGGMTPLPPPRGNFTPPSGGPGGLNHTPITFVPKIFSASKPILTFIILSLVFGLSISSAIPTQAINPAQDSMIAFAAFRNGQWDIFAVSAIDQSLRRLTNDTYEDQAPAFSPQGTHLAYASKRDGNWDIYLLNLQTDEETRLTTHPHYDGAPAWRPGGDSGPDIIAFESYRSGNLDVWLLELTLDRYSEPLLQAEPLNLTLAAPAESGQFSPAWHPAGQPLFLTSWQTGNHDIWALNTETAEWTQMTNAPEGELQPTWHPGLNTLAFTQNKLGQQDVFVMVDDVGSSLSEEQAVNHDRAVPSLTLKQLTWVGNLSYPDFSPDGRAMVGLLRTHFGSQIVRQDIAQPDDLWSSPQLHHLTERTLIQGPLDWHPQAILAGESLTHLVEPDPWPLYTEIVRPSDSPEGEPYNLIRLSDLETSIPWLADTVDDSFRAMRNHLHQELGYDFLGKLAEMSRPIHFHSDDSLYTSWHKSGRAFDTRFDLPAGQFEIGREVIGGETYWRMYLRCTDQSGRCGRPLTAKLWNYSQRARTIIAPAQGGIEKPNLSGYYVDFTRVAEMYGWERISSYDDEDFSWRFNFIAFEFWHYQKTNRYLNAQTDWYQTMREVHPQAKVDRYFNWEKMIAYDESPYLIITKGIPHPPEAQRWWQTLVPQ